MPAVVRSSVVLLSGLCGIFSTASLQAVDPPLPAKLRPWLEPQNGQRDVENPVLESTALKTPAGRQQFTRWQAESRKSLREMLGIPGQRAPLDAESRGQLRRDGIVIEKWIYTAEPGSRIPAVLYRPEKSTGRLPAMVLTFGHGGSKSHVSYNYMGQLYARLGIACLAADPLGEEERHIEGRMGTRAHDSPQAHTSAWEAGRPIMGKLVLDTMRGVDYLCSRDDIDPVRIGVAGNSLGGAKAGWMLALDERLRLAIVSGWAFDDVALQTKLCTSAPNQRMRQRFDWDEYLSLAAPHCAVLVMNGTSDTVIDRAGNGEAWEGTRRAVARAEKVYAALGRPQAIRCWFEPGGGHRPYPAHKAALAWLVEHLQPSGWSKEKVDALPQINFGLWARQNNVTFEKLYGTPLHLVGATVADVQIRRIGPEELRVLRPEEAGQPQFTLTGWLEQIRARPEGQ